MSRSLPMIAALSFGAAALTGCGLVDSSSRPDPAAVAATTSPSSASVSPAPSVSSASAAPLATEPAATVPSIPAGGRLTGTSKRIVDHSIPVTVTLTRAQRESGLLTIDLDVRNSITPAESARVSSSSWYVSQFFDDGTTNGLNGSDYALTSNSTDGIYLVDPLHRQRYPVARDTSGHCVCSTNLSNTNLGPGESVQLTATFAAPPADVTSIDVSVPNVGVFNHVTLR